MSHKKAEDGKGNLHTGNITYIYRLLRAKTKKKVDKENQR
jgi:hypothetical protein